jgi:tellurite resistance protein
MPRVSAARVSAAQRPATKAGGDVTFTVTMKVGSGPQRRSRPDQARWIGSGEPVAVAGYTIEGGLLYVGQHLNPVAGWREVEPALVNPALPIDDDGLDWAGEQMPYWPSYSELAPGCRAAYLRWLADGRKHPTVGIGYVFLFFYGLERRLMADATRAALPPGEEESIVGEVERLLSLYGGQASFARYAGDFVAVHRLAANRGRVSDGPPPTVAGRVPELPLALRVGLGEFSATGRPIPAEWAFAWVRTHPEIHLRTPAQRCSAEFEALFLHRYRSQFGEGIVVKPNKSRISAAYRPASASFEGSVPVPLPDLPDLAVLTAPIRKLQQIAENCTDDLDAYSRLVGRDPSARGTLAGIALLPAELAAQHQGADATRLRTWVEQAMSGEDAATVDGEQLLRQWSAEKPDRLAKGDAVLLAQFLQKIGVGLEPDVRFGGGPPGDDTKVVLFRLPAESPATPSAQYHAASVLLHLAAAVAQADGSLDEAEERHLIGHLQEALHFEKPERLRLAAHLRWVLANPVGLGGLKKRLAQIDGSKRHAVAQFLLTVAGADGRIEPSEVKTLTKIYSLLGLDAARVYADLHELGLAEVDTGPVTVRVGAPAQPGFKIPVPPTSVPSGLVLDPERVRARMAETAAVGALLRDVFVEDEPLPAPPSVGSGVTGLDEVHSEFLKALAARSSWPRAELEASAARLRLMLDGALELINDRAFDTCGQPACEGDDPVETNAEVLKELLA